MWMCRCKGPSCSTHFLMGLRLRRAARRLSQCADDSAARKLDLEGVVREALGVAQQQVCGPVEIIRARSLPAEHRFRSLVAPRLVRDAAERKPGLLDDLALDLESNGNRYQRERIG